MSSIISIIPIVLLFVLMLGFKMAGHKSALITLIVTILLALFVAPQMNMIPDKFADASVGGLVWWSFVEGVLKAVFPILIIILMAIEIIIIVTESLTQSVTIVKH